MSIYAHSKPGSPMGDWQTLQDHGKAVAEDRHICIQRKVGTNAFSVNQNLDTATLINKHQRLIELSEEVVGDNRTLNRYIGIDSG